MMSEDHSPQPMSKAEAFRRACERNALRRHAQLPFIPMTRAIEEELHRDAARLYQAAAAYHEGDYQHIRAQVVMQFKAERGPDFGQSVGGRWLVDYFAGVRFREFLASRGFVPPKSRGVVYGAARYR